MINKRIQIAKNTKNIKILEKMSKDSSVIVKCEVALNIYYQLELSNKLIIDLLINHNYNYNIRYCICFSKRKFSNEVYEILSKDSDSHIRHYIAMKCDDINLLEKLSNDISEIVR